MTTVNQSQTAISVSQAMSGRLLRDKLFKNFMSVGGIGVIVAISAIFFYLASVVVPLFLPPTVETPAVYAVPGPAERTTGAFSGEEQREIGARIASDGGLTFFEFATGRVLADAPVAIPAESRVTSFAKGDLSTYVFAYGLSDGRVVAIRQGYEVSFPGGKRQITPSLEYPLGETPLVVDERARALVQLAVQSSPSGSTLVGLTDDGRLLVSAVNVTANPITGETKSEIQQGEISPVPGGVRQLVVESKQRELFVLHGERGLARYDISDKTQPRLLETVQIAPEGHRVTALAMLSGGYSLIVGTDKGHLAQWFPVRTEGTRFELKRIREFKPMPAAVTAIAPEFFRKGFIVGDESGMLGSYYATSNRLLFTRKLSDQPISVLGVPPRGNGFLAQDAAGKVYAAAVENHYPEVSWHAMWEKVWYEAYEAPDYVWQSSAANSDFEPKFSLAPLTFGTLKAATYAMLVAVPLALLGAIFTAYFMSPQMRQIVKPTIEVMEALPTVILGFLAGLWLAPFVENNLAGVLLAIVLMPAVFIAAAYLWHLLPASLKARIPPGWEAALLIPVIVAFIWAIMQIGHPIEAAFFGGDMPNWVSNELGIKYEQRNSLVVGIAMGFAVTPTIFSIAEDAVFSVPKHLTAGSLALGATPWQTLTRVVLLTASPGIFSAVMIGLGRAVGETMIVLMATGNTAVMDFSLFTGFRTLSANIGVEMPEAGVGETHYRLLFLSALVLFAFTFVVNTLAELVRQRLRERYQTI
ncbi:ABC transporter permease subunit [Azohydromonas sediminis]|uniref:ABC transporter permease subunit n=1 Tax=Azohydromonas sediminis TaxID=2259674 RepID=UPI000E65592B|nr:ABC transporter permease subunit [Azohydromonas sediminis]